MKLDGRRVLVMGMGHSGQAAARRALVLGAEVTATDLRTDATTVEGCTHVYGEHRREDFSSATLIIVSPGVPAAHPDLVDAVSHGIPVVSELGWAAEQVQALGIPIIAVTGTNGKSSVTHFVGQFLEAAGRRPFVGGNIGQPLTQLLDAPESVDIAVVEVSSYQLELPDGLRPQAAAILNLAPDHLARHGDMQSYADTKMRLFADMPATGFCAVPPPGVHNPEGRIGFGQTEATRLLIGGSPGVHLDGHTAIFSGTSDDGSIDLSGLTVLGTHNQTNAAAAALLCLCVGVPRNSLDPSILTPLPHRLEPIHRADGVIWINDSKATNIDATLVGIQGLQGRLVVLLGGQGKPGADYERLRPALAAQAKQILCFGKSGADIAMALEGLPVSRVVTLADAVSAAAQIAQAPDVVLLSPACASFDEFDNFEKRGVAFASLAEEATR